MRTKLIEALQQVCVNLGVDGLAFSLAPTKYADLTTNLPLVIAPKLKIEPQIFAKKLLAKIHLPEGVSVEVSKEGFINFFYSSALKTKLLNQLIDCKGPTFKSRLSLGTELNTARKNAWSISLTRLGCPVFLKALSFGYTTLDKAVLDERILAFFLLSVPAHQDLHLSAVYMQQEDMDNPWYLIDYALKRNRMVIDALLERGILSVDCIDKEQWPLHSLNLLDELLQFEWQLSEACLGGQVFQLHGYAKNLARTIHYYYNRVTLVSTNPVVCSANLMLLQAAQRVLTNSLKLLGVNVE